MPKEERKLTPAEQKRKADFEVLCEAMRKDGYHRMDLTVGVVKANLVAVVVMLPFALAAVVGFFLAAPKGGVHWPDSESLGNWFLLLLAVLLLCAVHEGIHGLCWGICAKRHFRSIRFGMIWSALTPYCTCSEVLPRGQYIFGAAMPTVLLGFLPAVVAICLANPWLLFLSVLMLFGGGADFYIILKMLRYYPAGKEVVFCDHPYECGTVAFFR